MIDGKGAGLKSIRDETDGQSAKGDGANTSGIKVVEGNVRLFLRRGASSYSLGSEQGVSD